MQRRDVIGAGGSAMAAALAGCVTDPEAVEGDDEPYVRKRDQADNESGGTLADEDLTFPEHRFVENEDDFRLSYVTGRVLNEGDATGERVMVRAEFLDDAGEAVGSEADGVGSVDPGEVDIFEVDVPADLERDAFADYTLSATDAE